MTNVFAVVGQHRVEPGRLLLLGEDGRYYAYAADGRPTVVRSMAGWLLDGEQPTADQAVEATAEPVVPAPAPLAVRPPRLSLPAPRWAASLRAVAAGLALLFGALVAVPAALAHAPALVTAETTLDLRAAPAADAAVLATLPAGTTVELTGEAEGDFLEVTVDGQQGWVGGGTLERLDTAAVAAATALRTEPNADGRTVREVPAGSTVILTGAAVDGYLAASFEGAGGWIAADSLS